MFWIFLFAFAINLLLIFWASYTLPFHKYLKIFIFLALSFGASYYTPLGFLSDFGLLLPRPLLLITSWLCAVSILVICAKVFHALAIILLKILSVIIKPIKPIFQYSYKSKNLSLAIFLLCITSASFAFYEALKIPRVNYIDLPIKNLPATLENYTITHITDTHIGILYDKKIVSTYVKLINVLNSNLIVHTGDTGDATPNTIKIALDELQKLHAPDGVYYVFGNHETYQVLSTWRDYYINNNMNYLEDSYTVIDNKFILSGAAAGSRATPTNYNAIFKNAPENLIRIHLDHFPTRAKAASAHVDVQLSGHTHGGLTFFIAPIVAAANNGFVNGYYKVNDMHLYVGAGTSIWSYSPLRLFVPSEITVLKLVKS